MHLFGVLCVAVFITIPAIAGDIKAIVNDTPISGFDVETRAKMLMFQQAGRVGKLTPELKQAALNELIDERIKIQEMEKREIDISSDRIQDALGHLEEQNGLPKGGFQKILEEQGIPYRTLTEQTKANLGWLQIMQNTGRDVQVLPADIEARKQIIRQDLRQEKISFAEIVVKTEEEALTILQQLQNGSDFGIMVELHSISDSRVSGGRVVDVSPDYYGEDVGEILKEMQAGQLSRPIKIKDGYALFLMIKKREALTGDTITVWELAQAILPNDSVVLPLLEQPLQNGCDSFSEIVKDDAVEGSFQRGQITPSQLPEDIAPMLDAAEFEKVVGPLQTPAGLLYFMKCARSEERVMPTDEMLKMQIENEKLDLLSRQLLSEIKRDAIIEYK